MSAATALPPTQPQPLTDDDVKWFGTSHRLIGGQPDSRYGWLNNPDGPCIVKAISTGLTAYAPTLLEHERKMLKRLAEIKAPVPPMVDVGRHDWLVTRFGGLSLQRLELGQLGAAPLPSFAERLSAWVHLLRRLQTMAEAGVLAIDLYSANVVLPLKGITEGQLCLHEAALIDHAHTLEAGSNIRRPVWLNTDMARIAPELRSAMKADMAVLTDAFAKAGANLPGHSRLPSDQDKLSRQVWAQYDAPQQVQSMLDRDKLKPNLVMQFAAGVGLRSLLAHTTSAPQKQALADVLARMTDPQASERFPTLTLAAEALATVVDALPKVSAHGYVRLQASDLALPDAPAAYPPPIEPFTVVEPFTELADGSTPDAPKPGLPMHWLYATAGLGAACGAMWPW